ncbi:tRNA (adenosine(37)-N6)-threonylcarbamoyltransferase complex ATPase subunit type 1 TsaE [Pelagibacteraceae bacterium]|jgi:tRNA threonylcarbamoyladenosine biosynthesis protein TsaE|nr:tRNA (adenosine(37)-N6)-threonylcarbamoyltransferase complex ATPase subunit type 1 TsaE [Pelagibacteraceae bacterium]|tara:strand:+ start:368 stop:817 length:450 start_codon:yes stop_codon:yes gene_type:complete
MIINSLDQLNKISLKIIKKISEEDCVLLFGEIGVGKTTLTRALINNLQKQKKEDETEVLSPTFNIVYEYEISSLKVMHYDLYRLKSKKAIKQLGVLEQDTKNIKVIEWPEIMEDRPDERLEIYMSYKKDKNSRKISFKGFGKWKKFNAI